jgi:hypothetical protein
MTVTPAPGLAADRALPQRDVLLDEAAMAVRLARAFDGDAPVAISRCELIRVNYQIGRSLRALYRVEMDGACWMIAARTFRDGRTEEVFSQACETAVRRGSVRPVFHDRNLNTVFWTFPNDRKIRSLPLVANARVDVGDAGLRGWTASRLSAYAPEKSATFACLDGSGTVIAYAKTCAEHQAERDYGVYRALAGVVGDVYPHVRVPRAIAYVSAHRLLVIEAIVGRRLADAGDGDRGADLRRLGAALAAWHRITPPDAPQFARFQPDALESAARLVARVRPDVAPLVDRLARELASSRAPATDESVCLHGDVHPKNAIATGDGIALFDVEDLAIGPAAADVGSLLAGLVYLRRASRISVDTHEELASAFLDGYASVRPLPRRQALGWHTAAALLVERVLRAVTRVRPLGLLHLEELLADAAAIVGSRGRLEGRS